MSASAAARSIEDKAAKLDQMARLLIECRDALPAITVDRRRLYDVRPDLADRIDRELEPWAVPDDTPGAI